MNLALANYGYEAYGYNTPDRRRQTSSAVVPGEALTKEVMNRLTQRRKFFDLIEMFSKTKFYENENSKISETTAEAAKVFFTLLRSYNLPRIVPDGEGGLLSVWEGDSTVMLLIDGWTLHLVTNATTPQAQYYDDIRFNEEGIPTEILNGIRGLV